MTKLMEWLFCVVVLLGSWIAAITGQIQSPWTIKHYQLILYSPLVFLSLFGLYAASVVLYRTFTFNNCEDAAKQLKRQIEEAQAALRIQGVLPRDPKGPELM